MARQSNFNRRLRIERLELRELLCSAMAGSTSLQAASQTALFGRGHTSAVVASNSTTSSSSSDEANETHLFATLTNSSGVVVGTVAYETNSDGTSQKLLISVVGATANASYAVTVGTTTLGTLTTNANGNGRLVLTTSGSSSSSGSTTSCGSSTTTGSLPADFTLAAGATIGLASTDTTVDSLSGTFATASGDIGFGNGYGGGGCHGDNSSTTRLVAALDNSGTSVGRAVFSTYTSSDGSTTEILRVHLKGADASATLDVSVDGTSLGSISTDTNGNGILILSSNPKSSNVGQLPSGFTVTSTSTITISNSTTGTSITGTFASSSSGTTASASVSSNRSFSHRRR